jgi:hypothetical protein
MIRMGYVLNIGYDFRKNLLCDQWLLSTATNVAPVKRFIRHLCVRTLDQCRRPLAFTNSGIIGSSSFGAEADSNPVTGRDVYQSL